MTPSLWLAAVPILILNVVASRRVTLDGLSERRQKFLQLLLVWIVPVAGALLVLAIHRQSSPSRRGFRDAPDAGDDHGASGQGVRELRGEIEGTE